LDWGSVRSTYHLRAAGGHPLTERIAVMKLIYTITLERSVTAAELAYWENTTSIQEAARQEQTAYDSNDLYAEDIVSANDVVNVSIKGVE
jgi:hypothetical protein